MGWGAIGAIAAPFVGNLIGGELDRQAAERNNKRELAWGREQMAMQETFARMGIRWKAEDAAAAGLHPLAALGASTQGYSPVNVAFQETSQGDAFRNMGQDINRARAATATQEERLMAKHQLKSMELDNQLKQHQIDQLNKPAMVGPGMPNTEPFGSIKGQGNSIDEDIIAAKIWAALGFRGAAPHSERTAQERGYRPDVSYSQGDKAVYPVIPESLSESMEDDVIGKVLWRIRNQIVPNFGAGKTPPKSDLPPGYHRWRWSLTKQGWVPEKRKYKTWFERGGN